MSDLLSRLTAKSCTKKESIIAHIECLLTTRQGSMQHLPDYGMGIFSNNDNALLGQSTFCQHMAKQIQRYEPRISQLTVERVISHDCYTPMQFRLSYLLPDNQHEQVLFTYLPNGRVRWHEAVH